MIIIKNGALVTPQGLRRADLAMEGDKIVRIAAAIEPAEGDTVEDAAGCWVFPGFIDGHTAAFKVVGRRGVAHIEIEVRVRVDKAGEEHAARHVDDLALRGELGRDVAKHFDLFPVDEHVGAAAAAAADNIAASKQCFHGRTLL